MAPKKPASEKPVDISPALWEIFMAHKGHITQDSESTLGDSGTVVYTRQPTAADIAEVLRLARSHKSQRAEDYERDRQRRIARGKEGG